LVASLLLFAVRKGKNKALNAQCINNQRQLGIALSQFQADVHEYPLVVCSSRGQTVFLHHERTWAVSLQQYIAQDDRRHGERDPIEAGVWNCPAAVQSATERQGGPFISYGYNAYGISSDPRRQSWGLGGTLSTDEIKPVPENGVANPTTMMAIGDGFSGKRDTINDNSFTLWRNPVIKSVEGATARSMRRHSKQANILFCDLHLETIPLPRLFDSRETSDLKLWNRDDKPHTENLASQ
jgi:prepilin-type processing-associated H-X9-DG protein